MKVYFLPSYKQQTPSSRMRVHKVSDYLQQQGQVVEILSYDLPIPEKNKRLQSILPDDILYVQKWRTEFNAIEHLQNYKGKCKIVFDMDDATGDKQAIDMIGLCDALIVGNHFLQDKYSNLGKPVFLIPSPVDLCEYPKFIKEGPLAISLAKCGISPQIGPLKKLKNTIDGLRKQYNCELVLAGFNNQSDIDVVKESFPFARCLSLETYDNYLRKTVPILQATTVGILPFAKRDEGKSGHSALANLAMGIPCVASKYAECDYIIKDGVNGFLINSFDEWFTKIEMLFKNPTLRVQIRQAGWKTISERYDVSTVSQKLLENLKQI